MIPLGMRPPTRIWINKQGSLYYIALNRYWSVTESAANPDDAWFFGFSNGAQDYDHKYIGYYAIAVRPGDVAVVPEPISSILFVIGGIVLIGRRYLKRKK